MKARRGMTVIELLVASAVLATVLGLAAVYLAQQSQLQRNVQARNEVQDRVRVAMQLLTQDIALAGNTLLVTPAGAVTTPTGFPGCFPQTGGGSSCVELGNVSASSSTLRLRYVSSLFPAAEACRDVSYQLSNGTLERSDVSCGAPDVFVPLAPNMLGFKVVMVCSNGSRFATFPEAGCGGGISYGRSALVSVAGQSTWATAGASPQVGLVTTTIGSETTIDCPTGRICFGITQEVLIPNLKDQ
jgi:prepilin-type N-terminal cleavage/methylation domain-containing protein